ncbi:hypothetical protein SAMN05421636_10572 [Pricia antarctica]|uniref:Uncharacterized protein n=1 Tax=Pricia antarctica TaxID=641691 RepID=A0A1G7CXG2_9FLAO|nr:hypothetical protein [Pricia antarctica]SDE43978.1 hypothetical protein SAMN05421636_10572 [Pricia antarctica]
MRPKIQKQTKKHFFIKSYAHLWQLEDAIKVALKEGSERLSLSVLGKLAEHCISGDRKILDSKKQLKAYWRGSLGPNTDFGLFCNPEIGTLFIAGNLVSQFLHDLDGKALGTMSSGPYGILRGLGLPKDDAARYIKLLNEEHFLLMARGYCYQLDRLGEELEKLQKME